MADFFSNILDRAFDRAPVIQPQRAPLFAPTPRPNSPQPAWDDLTLEPPAAPGITDEALVSHWPTQQRPTRPAARSPLLDRDAEDRLDDGGSQTHQPYTNVSDAAHQTRLHDEGLVAQPSRTMMAAHTQAVAPLDTIRASQRAPNTPDTFDENALFSRLLAAFPKAQGEDAAHPDRTSLGQEPQAARVPNPSTADAFTATTSQLVPVVNPASPNALVDGEPSEPRLSHPPPHAPAIAPMAHVPTVRRVVPNDLVSGAADGAPTVTISIGRIEVRATQQPAAHSQAAPRAPATADARRISQQRHAEGGDR